jgi:hypothetical protein
MIVIVVLLGCINILLICVARVYICKRWLAGYLLGLVFTVKIVGPLHTSALRSHRGEQRMYVHLDVLAIICANRVLTTAPTRESCIHNA